MKRPKREKLDVLNAEQVNDFAGSPGWQLIRERIRTSGAGKLEELKRDLGPEQTAKCRGYIEALEMVLRLPVILEEEGKANGVSS